MVLQQLYLKRVAGGIGLGLGPGGLGLGPGGLGPGLLP